MSLLFKRNSPDSSKWRNTNPFLLMGRTALLVDDLFLAGSHKAAGKIERASDKLTNGRFVVGKERLALATMLISWGCFARLPSSDASSSLRSTFAIGSALFFCESAIYISDSFKTPVQTGPVEALSPMKFLNHVCASVTSLTSLNILAFSLYDILSHNLKNFGTELPLLGWTSGLSFAFYLASGSNGMLNRFKSWAKEMSAKMKEFTVSASQPELETVKIR